MRKVILSFAMFIAMALFYKPCMASELGPSITQSTVSDSLGNVTVTTTTDIATGMITVETNITDPSTGVVTRITQITNTLTGEVSNTSETIKPRKCGYIYVGDSRYKGLDMFTNMSADPSVWLLAEVSKGYGWLSSTAVSQINTIEANNPQITDWYEIYTLGINDPGNISKYTEWYIQRAATHNVILVSINPIERHSSLTNEYISKINSSLVSTGLNYIDSYNYLMKTGFSTADGVHFNKSTNKVINNYVTSSVKKISGDV